MTRCKLQLALMTAALLLAPGLARALPALHGVVGVASARPALLETGLVMGAGATALTTGAFAWGVQTSLGSAAESDEFWAVSHLEWRLRLLGALQRRIGRGMVGLRLGVGSSLVYERRDRHQAGRMGGFVDDLSDSALALVPGADLQAAVGVAVSGHWGVSLSAGPSLHLPSSGGARLGFFGQVGIARLP